MPWNCEEKSIIDQQLELKGKKKTIFHYRKKSEYIPHLCWPDI